MTILISMMTIMMMSKAYLGCSFFYFVSYFDFWMFGTLECASRHNEYLYDISYDVGYDI